MISLSNPTMTDSSFVYDPITDDLYSDEIDVIPDDEGYFNGQETFSDKDVFQQNDTDDDMYEPDFQYYD